MRKLNSSIGQRTRWRYVWHHFRELTKLVIFHSIKVNPDGSGNCSCHYNPRVFSVTFSLFSVLFDHRKLCYLEHLKLPTVILSNPDCVISPPGFFEVPFKMVSNMTPPGLLSSWLKYRFSSVNRIDCHLRSMTPLLYENLTC